MGHNLSTRNSVPATERLLDTGLRADFRTISIRYLHEALDIYRNILNMPDKLDLDTFDQVFGVMLGDAEPHFKLLSGEVNGTQPAGPLMCDAVTVFLTLTLLAPVSKLKQLAFIYELITGETAADIGLTAKQLSMVMEKSCVGLCRLLGSKVPEQRVFVVTANAMAQDADERTCVPLVKRRHLNSFLEADLLIKKFFAAASERIVGSDLDNASVAGAYLDGGLLGDSDDEMDTAHEIEVKMNNEGGHLVSKRLRSLARTSWFVARSKRTCVDVNMTCGTMLKIFHDTGSAASSLSGHCLPLLEHIPKPSNRDEDGDTLTNSSSDEEERPEEAFPKERVSCGITSCVGFIDAHHLLESFLDVLMDEAQSLLVEHHHHHRHGNGDDLSQKNSQPSPDIASSLQDEKSNNQSKQKQKKKTRNKQKSRTSPKLAKFVVTAGTRWSEDAWTNSDMKRSTAIHLLLEQPLIHAMDALGREGNRAALLCHSLDMDERSNVTHILTEWDLFEAVLDHDDIWLKGCCHATMKELGFCRLHSNEESGGILSIHQSDSTLNGFLKILSNVHQHALAVVDDAGVLVASLGVEDFVRLLMQGNKKDGMPNFEQLLSPIKRCTLHPVGAKVCSPSTLLSQVMDKMQTLQARDIFICDEEMRPVGTISVPDVLELCSALSESVAFRFIEAHKKTKIEAGKE